MKAKARATVLWGVVCFACVHVGMAVWLELGPPRLRDPEFGRKLSALKRRLVEYPDRQLIVVLGSSRVAGGLRPEVLRPRESTDPIVFNLGSLGAGPSRQRLFLERLLDAGIRPSRVVVELWPPFLLDGEADANDPNRLNRADLSRLRPYLINAPAMTKAWAAARGNPWFAHRQIMLNLTVPDFLSADIQLMRVAWDTDGWGWGRVKDVPELEQHRPEILAQRRAGVGHVFLAAADDQPRAETTLRDLLARCRCLEIPAAILVMPEASELNDWYPAAARARAERLIHEIAGEAKIPLIDGRRWSPDADLIDGIHLTRGGAACFTARLGVALREWKP